MIKVNGIVVTSITFQVNGETGDDYQPDILDDIFEVTDEECIRDLLDRSSIEYTIET